MSELVSFEVLALAAGAQYEVRELPGGIQVVIRFPNGYGASVVQHPYSYGGDRGLWEIAPVRWNSEVDGLETSWTLIGRSAGLLENDDVAGWLDSSDVDVILEEIRNL
jgi:hypothetical protein